MQVTSPAIVHFFTPAIRPGKGFKIMEEKKYFKIKTFTYWACKKCELSMSFNEMMYSHGICPHCDNYTKGTVVDCYPGRMTKGYETFWKWIKSEGVVIKNIRFKG